jgi:LacI family transcriptional regulator
MTAEGRAADTPPVLGARGPSAAVTLADVAAMAGVSLSTASRVLNGSTRRVSDARRQRVLDAAGQLGYSANTAAQAVARGTTNTVGLIVSDIADPFFSTIAAGLMRAAEAHRLVVTMACTFHHPERELDYVAALRGQRARAAVLVGSRVDDRELQDRLGTEIASFERAGGRVVMVSQPKLPVDTVVIENRAGARDLARELCGLGHRRFAILAGPPELLTARDRVAGFRQGLTRSGVTVPSVNIVHGPFTRDGGYMAMQDVLRRGLDVGCVFAVNDVMAVGAMAALRDHGQRDAGPRPLDGIAVAGFDDIEWLRDVVPSLTTVRLPLSEVGAAALDLVLQPPADRPRVRRVQGQVVLRPSTSLAAG